MPKNKLTAHMKAFAGAHRRLLEGFEATLAELAGASEIAHALMDLENTETGAQNSLPPVSGGPSVVVPGARVLDVGGGGGGGAANGVPQQSLGVGMKRARDW